MIVGKIVGKVNTRRFDMAVTQNVTKFEYLQVHHKSYGYVLCQLVEITKDEDKTIGSCHVLGYPDEDGNTKMIREPFEPSSEVLIAEDGFISQVVKLKNDEKGAYLGKLEGRDINIFLDLQKLLTKHLAVLAKSGAGKSYCVGVLLEEIMEKGVPLVVIDPHGEYFTLKYKSEEDGARLQRFGVQAKGYIRRVKQFGDAMQNADCTPLVLADNLDMQQLLHLLPKLSGTQEALLYNSLKHLNPITLDGLIYALDMEEAPAKYALIHQIQYLQSTKLFSKMPVDLNEIVQTNRCSIINMKGIAPDLQQLVAFKLLSDLFEARKKGQIPPFFCVIEEAHNFCPEKSFGNSKAGPIIRTIASEGRKFGLGLAVISQRPARVEKSVLSQVTTQLILKVTNPNDLKAISTSVEGITSESQNEIQNLTIGTALVTGVVDMPLFVNIRPRKTKHGGEAIDILEETKGAQLFEEIKDFKDQHIIPLIEPNITKKDVELMNTDKAVIVQQIPCALFSCQGNSTFTVLMELYGGKIVTDTNTFATKRLPNLSELSARELQLLEKAFFSKTFTIEEFCAKHGFPTDVINELRELVKKQYLLQQNEQFNINDGVILAQLSKYACYTKPVYKASPAEKKAKKNISLDKAKKQIERFTTVTNTQDCWLIHYEVV